MQRSAASASGCCHLPRGPAVRACVAAALLSRRVKLFASAPSRHRGQPPAQLGLLTAARGVLRLLLRVRGSETTLRDFADTAAPAACRSKPRRLACAGWRRRSSTSWRPSRWPSRCAPRWGRRAWTRCCRAETATSPSVRARRAPAPKACQLSCACLRSQRRRNHP